MGIDATVTESKYWNGELIRWPKSMLQALSLPDPAIDYLAEVGLPREEEWTFKFPEVPIDKTLTDAGRTFFLIGSDAGVPICLEVESGQVLEVPEAHESPKFVNSTIAGFGKFLQLYHQYRSAVSELDPDDPVDEQVALNIIADVEQQMRSLDPAALADSAHCWSEVLEQMKDGQL